MITVVGVKLNKKLSGKKDNLQKDTPRKKFLNKQASLGPCSGVTQTLSGSWGSSPRAAPDSMSEEDQEARGWQPCSPRRCHLGVTKLLCFEEDAMETDSGDAFISS